MTSVTVKITGKITGKSLIVPYSHDGGLQRYPPGHAKEGQPVIYKIAKYQVLIVGGGTYDAVRFGLQNKGTLESTRVSDAGLTSPRSVNPSWVTGYSPHTFAGSGGPYAGAWRILPGKGFLIHEGADETKGNVGGSLGCVEIVTGRWAEFQDELKSITGKDWPKIGSLQLMKLVVEAASSPTATLV
jgi:hypothetical protein